MGRPKTYDRARVLDRAMKLFWEKGYEGTHLRELVRVTGISRFSLYQEFGGKEGLFREALGAYVASLCDLVAVLDREPPGVGNLRAYFRAVLEFDFRHGCFAANTIHEKHVLPPSVYAEVHRFVAELEARFERNLRAARDAGELPPDLDVASHARLLACVDIGLIGHGIVEPDAERRERMVRELERLWS